jgi:hypothetical protein
MVFTRFETDAPVAAAALQRASSWFATNDVYTVFAETWHADSLARLSDADLANLWRLADYLMLDEACLKCLEDVVVQRLSCG